jgi:hypothetical protein
VSPPDDLAACRESIRRSRSFYVASRLLPARVRDAVATYDSAAQPTTRSARPAPKTPRAPAARRPPPARLHLWGRPSTPRPRLRPRRRHRLRIPRDEPDALADGMAQDL